MRRVGVMLALLGLVLPVLQPVYPEERTPPANPAGLAVAQAHALEAIHDAALRWHVSEDWLDRVARCESNLLPWAVNPETGAAGLFQFEPSTYWTYAPAINETKGPFDAWSAAQVAAYMFSIGQSWQWACQ